MPLEKQNNAPDSERASSGKWDKVKLGSGAERAVFAFIQKFYWSAPQFMNLRLCADFCH